MNNYIIKKGSIDELDIMQPLWEKLYACHRELSLHFKEEFKMEWEQRKSKLLEKSSKIHFEYVEEMESGEIVGYCVSTIEKGDGKTGELDSLFVEEKHRTFGIGRKLVSNSIDWMEKEGTKTQKLVVGVGNESVLDFYRKSDFYPRSIVLLRKKS